MYEGQELDSVELRPVRDVVLDLPTTGLSTGGRYTLAARAEKLDEGVDLTILNEVARPVAARFTGASFDCAHCHQKRARNTLLAVLDDQTNGLLLLGTECAKNYIATIDRDLQLLEFRSVIVTTFSDEAFEERSGGRASLRAWDLETALPVIAAVVREHGYSPLGPRAGEG